MDKLMKIIDSHVHLGKWDNPDFFGREMDSRELFYCFERWGIWGAVIMPTDKACNGEILDSLKDYPNEKYRFLPWVKPGDKKILKFCRENIGKISGLKFHPALDKTRVTDSSYEDFISLACENNLPVAVHCGRWEEIAGSKYPLEIAKRNEKLKVLLSHMGGDTPKLAFQTIEAIRKMNLKNVYLDTAGFREYWVIEKGVNEVGAQRFLFASDFPLGHPQAGISLIRNLDISEDQKNMILGRNAMKLFSWEEKRD